MTIELSKPFSDIEDYSTFCDHYSIRVDQRDRFRDPHILLSHIKDIEGIPYRGTGMGIKRIIKACEEYDIDVDFDNQSGNNQFKVNFWRK